MNTNYVATAAACFCLAAPAGALLAAPPAAAPLQPGTLSGYVRDTHGKPIAQAQVTIVSTGETTETDKDGAYVFTDEDPGLYVIKAVRVKYHYGVLTITVQPHATQTLSFVLADAASMPPSVVKGKKSPTTIIAVITAQKSRGPFPSDDPLESFPGSSGLHSTARSR